MDTSFDTVVLAIGPRDDDRLETLARTVIQVAEPTGATVILSHVFTRDQFEEFAEQLEYPSANEEDIDSFVDRHKSVRFMENQFDEYDVDYEVRGFVGSAAEKLVTLAGDRDADRLVVSGHKRTRVGKAVFGSTAQSILLEAPCPVTYVKPETQED